MSDVTNADTLKAKLTEQARSRGCDLEVAEAEGPTGPWRAMFMRTNELTGAKVEVLGVNGRDPDQALRRLRDLLLTGAR
jgi:hypothetical protein